MDDLPIRSFKGENLKKINQSVDRILIIKSGKSPSIKVLKELEELQFQIDSLVYQLYGIGSEEILIIENTF
jgi:hypothetical protein